MSSLFRDGDVPAGIGLGGLGAFMISEASNWAYYGPDGPGPGFFPICYGIAIVGLSLMLILGRLTRPQEEGAGASPDWRGVGRALASWAAFVAAIAAMQPLGFIVSFSLLTLFLVAVIFRRSLLVAMATSIGATAGFYVLFPLALGIELPAGRLLGI